MCLSVGGAVHMRAGARGEQRAEALTISRAGGTSSCELLDGDSENQTWVLCKSIVNPPALLATEPYLQAMKVPGWPGTPDHASPFTECTTMTSSLLVKPKLYVGTLRMGLGSSWISLCSSFLL